MNFFIALALLVLLFAVVYGIVVLWDRRFLAADSKNALKNERTPEGAFRFFYHILWVLLFLSLSIFLFPMLLSYRAEATQFREFERLELVVKMALMPIVLLLLIAYGRRRGYMRWLEDLSWPRRDR